VWLADLSPTRGREQHGRRPVLIVSATAFNRGPLVVVVPLTRTERRTPLHVPVDPPQGGLRERSFAMCDQVRAIARDRLLERWGGIEPGTLRQVVTRLHRVIALPG